jgi:predicted transposase/invertase (TIGR01784 family)
MSKFVLSHDAFFKKSLSIPSIAKEYMEMHLPINVQNFVNLSTLKMQQDSFVKTSLKKHVSDVLFSCKTNKGEPALIYLLCEHQSSPDYWMSFRLHEYILAIAKRYKKTNPKANTFPFIYPMVFYNGRKPHNCPRSLHQLFERPDIMKKVLYEDYHLINANDLVDEELKQKEWAGTMQFFMKHAFEKNVIHLLQQMIDALQKVTGESAGIDFLRSILWYNVNKLSDCDEESFSQVLTKIVNKEETENFMGSLARKYINVGKQEGVELGRQEGVEKRNIEIAISMLKEKEPIDKIIRFTGLTKNQVMSLQ